MSARSKPASRSRRHPERKNGARSIPVNELQTVRRIAIKARDTADPDVRQQLKVYEEALALFQGQKFQKARPLFEKVLSGPSKELADRATVHLRVCDQRAERAEPQTVRSAEDHYTHGVALMNLGRWDEAREHFERARKAAPHADHIIYALAALDCLCGEAEASLNNLALAIQLRQENRYLARNDVDFAFLQDDPRFTELLYPEREGFPG